MAKKKPQPQNVAAVVAACLNTKKLPENATRITVPGLSKEQVVEVALQLLEEKQITGIDLDGIDVWIRRITAAGRKLAATAPIRTVQRKRGGVTQLKM